MGAELGFSGIAVATVTMPEPDTEDDEAHDEECAQVE